MARVDPALAESLSHREVEMPDGTYRLTELPNGHWAVNPPRSREWEDGFQDRTEASLAIARGNVNSR
jgi:hypothetical protein